MPTDILQVDSPPNHTNPILSREDFHPELCSSNSVPHIQTTDCGPLPPQSIILANPSSSSNATILVGDTTINDIVRSPTPAFISNEHNEDDNHDIAGNVPHATPSIADLTDELTICRSKIYDLERSITACGEENEDYRESLKYQSEEIKSLRNTHRDTGTVRTQDYRDERILGCDIELGMNPFEEYTGVKGWSENNGKHHNDNLQKIIIFDDPPQELIYETEKSRERYLKDNSASRKVKILKSEIDDLKIRIRMLQREKDEKYWKDNASSFQEEVFGMPEEGEDDDSALEQALLQEKQDHLRTLSKIEEIADLKNKEIKELNDKLLDQQALVVEMLDANGTLTQRISELEKQLEDGHRFRMEQRSDDARKHREERSIGQVRAGVAGRTSEVSDAGLGDGVEDELEPGYYGW
ncbi:hypothetical protein I203_104653 [Kwoniella mangroviensis CBS 8507]|uniref:uncharacterized protein n=1 Tax=Kwoniella mangroviensis CBS 8507 TaxID=1296122 RepID=UPI00080CC3CB|nr:uncharacterized protein I203_00401 [Kwoniella mangroviensis CBS 8507]OCF70269.1 hypothetical protein I203_00401 [Kwoniella mangroviensis CBS 8507]